MTGALERVGYFHGLGFAVLLALVVSAGCNLVPQEHYKAEEAITLPDGTTANEGDLIYLDENDQATANAKDANGNDNRPLMVTDVDKLEKLKENTGTVTNALPPPFNWIAGLGVVVLAGGGIAGARAYRRKQLADAGIKPKGKK